MFSAEVCERIGYYVYALLDGEQAFYVGKGCGNRAFQHAAEALQLEPGETEETAKLARIRAIRDRGSQVEVVLLRHLLTEGEALILESTVIDLATSSPRFELTNAIAGHGAHLSGIMRANEIVALYDAPPIELDGAPLLLFKIPKLWHRGINPRDLYEATRGWWRVNRERAMRAKYCLAVSNGVVREVYEPRSWRKREPGEPGWTEREAERPRYGFEGVVAADPVADGWRNKSAAELFPRGFQGPFRYHRL